MNRAQSVFERTYQEQQEKNIQAQHKANEEARLNNLFALSAKNIGQFKSSVTHQEIKSYKKAADYDAWMKDQTTRGVKIYCFLIIAIIGLFYYGISSASTLSNLSLVTAAILSLIWLWYSLMMIMWIYTLIHDVFSGERKNRKKMMYLHSIYTEQTNPKR